MDRDELYRILKEYLEEDNNVVIEYYESGAVCQALPWEITTDGELCQ